MSAFYAHRNKSQNSKQDFHQQISVLQEKVNTADAVVLGAGSGLSTAAGFSYDGERFRTYFPDFIEKYGIRDMYSGGFYPFDTQEEYWAWWSRHIYVNRYMDAPTPLYQDLFSVMKDTDYFVLTTNVDHQFQKAGFDKQRLFYTQGDYGLLQELHPTRPVTYDNEDIVRNMMAAQGFEPDDRGIFQVPKGKPMKMKVPAELIPKSPVNGGPMTMNLRADDTFVEDAGWHQAQERYHRFLRKHDGEHVVFLELGVGMNTPGIIKFPFWQMVKRSPQSFYICVNKGEAACPQDISSRSLCIDADIAETVQVLKAGISSTSGRKNQ